MANELATQPENSSKSFTKEANFEGMTFAEAADFAGATFAGAARFAGAAFKETELTAFIVNKALLEAAHLAKKAELKAALLAEKAEIEAAIRAKHQARKAERKAEMAELEGATLAEKAELEGANFSGATFTEEADFRYATFAAPARFAGATFSKEANFEDATFTRPSYPFSSNTAAGGESVGATYTEVATVADFSSATFVGATRFARANFTSVADFSGATFTKVADFRGATFAMYAPFFTCANFSGAIFTEEADFRYATFATGANFINCELRSQTMFDKASFLRLPPLFDGTKLHEGTTWFGVTWPRSPRNSDYARLSVRAYERLKLEMDKLKKHEDELNFFALELKARRVLVGRWSTLHGMALGLYGCFCDYGRSYSRPLWLLGAVSAVGAVPFLVHFGLPEWPDSLALSAANTFALLGFRREFFSSSVISNLPSTLKLLSAMQTVAGGVLFFLFALALRNRFRMR